jgi:hypothetical protein
MYLLEIKYEDKIHIIEKIQVLEQSSDRPEVKFAYIEVPHNVLQLCHNDRFLRNFFSGIGSSCYPIIYQDPDFPMDENSQTSRCISSSPYRWIEISNSEKGKLATLLTDAVNQEFARHLPDFE